MAIYYSEFLATRRNAQLGMNIDEDTGEHRFTPDARVRNEVSKIVCNFAHRDYNNSGYYLYFHETLKKFICIRVSNGKKIDNTPNNEIIVRVPDERETDGFAECIELLKAWEGIQQNINSNTTIKDRYSLELDGITELTCALYEQLFSRRNKILQVAIKDNFLGEHLEAEFVIDAIQMCYQLLPVAKRNKLSFRWRVPKSAIHNERCILFTREADEGLGYDLSNNSDNNTSFEYWNMMSTIVNEAFDTATEYTFLDEVNNNAAALFDFENMYWEFLIYLMHKKRDFQFSYPEFMKMKDSIKERMYQRFPNAESLFWNIIKSLLNQELTVHEYGILLKECLDVFKEMDTSKESHVGIMCDLLWKYNNNNTDNIVQWIKKIDSQELKYDVLNYVIQKSKLDVNILRVIEPLERRTDIEAWISNRYTSNLREDENVKTLLMNIIEQLFNDARDINEVTKLMSLGYKIDRTHGLDICLSYMKGKIEYVCSAGSMIQYFAFLNQTQKIWKDVRMYNDILENAYLELATNLKGKIKMNEIRAFVEVSKWGFSNTREVQEILARKCREYLESIDRNDTEVRNSLALLEKWNTGYSHNDSEWHKSRNLLDALAAEDIKQRFQGLTLDEIMNFKCSNVNESVYYPIWIHEMNQKLHGRISYVKVYNQLEGIICFLKDIREKDDLNEILWKLFRCAIESCDIEYQMKLLWFADQVIEKTEFEKLLKTFWHSVKFEHFKKLYEVEKSFKRENISLKVCSLGNNMESKPRVMQWYSIYRDMHNSEKYIEVVRARAEKLMDQSEFHYIEGFFNTLLNELYSASNVSESLFKRINEILILYWNDERAFEGAIKKAYSDKKVSEYLIRCIKYGITPVKENAPNFLSNRDIVGGYIIGSVFALATMLWMTVEFQHGILAPVLLASSGCVMSLIFILVRLFFLKSELKLKNDIVVFGISGFVWSLLCGIYCVVGKNIIITLLVSIILFVLIYLYFEFKKRG